MMRTLLLVTFLVFGALAPAAVAQVKNFAPVTREMLVNPSPSDWLMHGRTYDEQRFSPLNQINRQNVGQLRTVWIRGMGTGLHENVPLVYQGILYVANPGTVIQALDATNGELLWEYRRKLPDDITKYIAGPGRIRAMALFEDMIFFTAPDGYVVALDAGTGKLRWETKVQDYQAGTQHTAGPIVAEGMVISGRSCPDPQTTRAGCFIVANDARTGKEVWKFFVTAAPGEPGGDTWGNMPVDERMASAWGAPGSYDPIRKLTYWGVANPRPYTRMKRHGGDPDAVSRSAPAELYSNSTVALDPNTGKLSWYYQYLPGDDWDADFTHERVLLRTPFNPDPTAVKWINPRIPRGQQRDVAVISAASGGLWVNDRATGEFLWSTPFPYDSPYFLISKVDVETGKTYINWDVVLKQDGDKHIVCYGRTKVYWSMAYHPGKNSLYIPFHDGCIDIGADMKNEEGISHRINILRPGADLSAYAGIAKVNMATGQVQRIHTQRAPGNGAMLATAGDLIFWGDMDRRFRAFDTDTGKILWEAIVGGIIQNSTISYAVNGKQYVAVLTGDGSSATGSPLGIAKDIKPQRGHNAIYVFALP